MHLVSFYEPVAYSLQKSAGGKVFTFEPYRSYLVANVQVHKFLSDESAKHALYQYSNIDYRIPNFNAKVAKKGRVLLYYGAGGYGDQIMTWPVAKAIADLGHQVFILTEPGNDSMWWGIPWVKAVHTIPMEWETFKMFDYFAHAEAGVNHDMHPEQRHPSDALLTKFGIEPETVDRSGVPIFTGKERADGLQSLGGEKTIFYQLCASNSLRSWSPEKSLAIAKALAEEFSAYKVIALYDKFNDAAYKTAVDTASIPNLKSQEYTSLRVLMNAVTEAKLCVGPDSFLIHCAGVFGTPSVSIWGATSPQERIMYYRNAAAIWSRQLCPLAPCRYVAADVPPFCPARADNPNVKYCRCQEDVSTEEILIQAKKMIRS